MHAYHKFMPFNYLFSITLIHIDQSTALLKVSFFSHQIRIVQYPSKDEFIILIICGQPSQAPQSLHPLQISFIAHSLQLLQ